MTTLRREIRKRFTDILGKYLSDVPMREEDANSLIEELVLAVDVAKTPKIDLSKTDPAWAILAGESILQEDQDDSLLAANALVAFEEDMSTPDNWNWYPAKTSEDSAWKLLRDFVIARYLEDKKCFEKYQTWRTQPYARGAMSNLAIKRNPENFSTSWTDFLASAAYSKPEQKNKVQLDDHGAPISY